MTLLAIIAGYVVLRIIMRDHHRLTAKAKPTTAPQTARKEAERFQRQEEKRVKQEAKLEQKKAQASEDLPFYQIQLDRLLPTAESTRTLYKKAVEAVRHDEAMNSYGAVVKGEVVEKHLAERDRLLRRLIVTENQIHALEKKIMTAEAILDS